MNEQALARGQVTRVEPGVGVWVLVPDLGGMEVGPIQHDGTKFARGDRVVIAQLDSAGVDYVVLGRLVGSPDTSAADELARRFAFRPAVGDYVLPVGFASSSNGLPPSGTALFTPIDIARPATYSHVAYRISTNAAGGSVSLAFGLYADNGDGNRPDLELRLAVTPMPDPLTAGTNKELAFDTPVLLHPGRYWLGGLYLQASAPSTPPVLSLASNVASGWSDPGVFWWNGGTPTRALEAVGQTSLPTTPQTLAGTASNAPVFAGLRRSA